MWTITFFLYRSVARVVLCRNRGSRHIQPKTSVSADALLQVIDFVEGHKTAYDRFNADVEDESGERDPFCSPYNQRLSIFAVPGMTKRRFSVECARYPDSASFRLSSVLSEKLLTGIGWLEHAQRKDKTMMNNRAKTLWLPALASLTGSMAWRFILQRSFPQSQTLLNHAGLPLAYQLLWLAALHCLVH